VKRSDLPYYIRARRHGARYARKLIEEAAREGVRLSLAFAVVDQETGGTFRNVYGHDAVRNPIKSPPGGLRNVTRRNYRKYLRYRKAGLGMQGVGPMQLTWWATQDLADHEGGCWRPRFNIRIGLRQLHDNIAAHGQHAGIAAYNGSGPAAERYAASVEQKQQKWHRILTGGKA
jgi:hypothetical protein